LGEQMTAGDLFLIEKADAFRPPAYPAFLAGIQSLSGEHSRWAVMIIQQLLVFATAVLVAWLVWRITLSRIAVLASLALSMICVSRAFFATQVWSEDLLAPLLAVHVALAVGWHRKPSLWLAAGLGLTVGICALTRPAAQYLIAPVVLGMLMRRGEPHDRWGAVRHAVLALAVMLVTVAPWYARNYHVFENPFLTKGKGRSLWLSAFQPNCGNLPFPDTDEFRRAEAALERFRERAPDVTPLRTWDVYNALRYSGMSELDAEKLMVTVAKTAIRESPLSFAGSVADRWWRYWTVTFVQDRNQARYQNRPASLLGRIQHRYRQFSIHGLAFVNGGLAVLAAVGVMALLVRRETRSLAVALGLMLLYFPTISAVAAQPMYRLRLIVEPVMILCIACGIERGISTVRRWRAPCKSGFDPVVDNER
jgi:hypothetical protein